MRTPDPVQVVRIALDFLLVLQQFVQVRVEAAVDSLSTLADQMVDRVLVFLRHVVDTLLYAVQTVRKQYLTVNLWSNSSNYH